MSAREHLPVRERRGGGVPAPERVDDGPRTCLIDGVRDQPGFESCVRRVELSERREVAVDETRSEELRNGRHAPTLVGGFERRRASGRRCQHTSSVPARDDTAAHRRCERGDSDSHGLSATGS
jgi:hypothetical protein